MRRVVIVGGGITGLSTAFLLQKEIETNNLPIQVTLVEAGDRLGGKIETEYRDGFVIERGPDSYLARKKSMTQLIEAVGLTNDLVNNNTGQAYVLHQKKLHPIPEGAVMGIPTEISPFLTSGLFSVKGKARAGMDLVLPKSHVEGDQALGTFFKRRLGTEVVEHLIEPLLSGIYAGDIDRISLQSTFPQFKQIETQYRSLILGMKKNRSQDRPKSSKGVFLTLKKGLSSLVEELESQLSDKIDILKGTEVEHLNPSEKGYSLQLSNGQLMETDQVVVTIPGLKSASLFNKDIKDLLIDVPATSVATVAMAFPKSALKQDINGTGFVVSKKSPYTITACTWTHKKWQHTTPEGSVLLRCYVGREHDQQIVDEPDEVILSKVLADLNTIMKIEERPTFYYVSRWKKAMPQYLVDHESRRNQLRSLLEKEYPGVQMVGASLDGIGLPDCVAAGEKAAENVIKGFGF